VFNVPPDVLLLAPSPLLSQPSHTHTSLSPVSNTNIYSNKQVSDNSLDIPEANVLIQI
jgi:hypothetical protein